MVFYKMRHTALRKVCKDFTMLFYKMRHTVVRRGGKDFTMLAQGVS